MAYNTTHLDGKDPKDHLEHIKNNISDHRLLEIISRNKINWPRENVGAFAQLVRSLIFQNISQKSAANIWLKLQQATAITPQTLIAFRKPQYKKCSIGNFKAEYIKNLARFALINDLNKITPENYQDHRQNLLNIKGVGEWTLMMFEIFHLHALDVFPTGDLAVMNQLARLFNNNEKLTKQQALKVAEKWKPYRTIAALALWAESREMSNNKDGGKINQTAKDAVTFTKVGE